MTLTFNATFGVTPGYGHNNENANDDALSLVAGVWQRTMEAEMATTGILVSAVMSRAVVVYPQEFGCPRDGEAVVEATGVMNPKYVAAEDADDWQRGLLAWKEAVIRVVKATKAELKQERVTLFFQEVKSFHYLEKD